MELTAKGREGRATPFESLTSSFQGTASASILLSVFEAELQALLQIVQSERSGALSESLIRRFAVAEDTFQDIEEGFGRIQLLMMMLSDSLVK